MLSFFKNLSPTEIAAIALIFIVFFGANTVKKMARIGGESMKEINKMKKNFSSAVEEDLKDNKKGVSKK